MKNKKNYLPLLLAFLCFNAWAEDMGIDKYTVHSLENQTPKNSANLQSITSPHQDEDACRITTIIATHRHLSWRERVDYLLTGTLPASEGTGTVVKEGVVTNAHLFLHKVQTPLLKREVFALYRPFLIERGITTDELGQDKSLDKWPPPSEKKSPKVETSIIEKMIERDWFEEISQVEWNGQDLALVTGTGFKNKKCNLIDDVNFYRAQKNLTAAQCFHYPNGLLPQKKSDGYVALNSSCSQIPSVHHDLVSTHGSSGAGIRDAHNKVFAVLCSGPACYEEFPERRYNHCIPIDKNVILTLGYNLHEEDKMRFKHLASIFAAFLSWDVALASHEDFPESKSGTFKPYPIQQHDGVMRGTFTPHNPGSMWKRVGVFAPTLRMVRIPLVIGAIPACFMASKCFGSPFWNDRNVLHPCIRAN